MIFHEKQTLNKSSICQVCYESDLVSVDRTLQKMVGMSLTAHKTRHAVAHSKDASNIAAIPKLNKPVEKNTQNNTCQN